MLIRLVFLIAIICPIAAASNRPLDDGTLSLIFSRAELSQEDLYRCSLVCKKWKRVADSDPVWQRFGTPHHIEIFRLMVTHCPTVEEWFEKMNPSKLPLISCQWRIFELMKKNKEAIKGEVTNVENLTHLSFQMSAGEIQIENEETKRLYEQFSLPSQTVLEELLVFAELYDGKQTSEYIWRQGSAVRKLKHFHDVFNLYFQIKAHLYRVIRDMLLRLIALGSRAAIREDLAYQANSPIYKSLCE